MLIMSLLLLAASPAPQANVADAGPGDLRTADNRLNAQYRATLAKMKARDAYKAPDALTGPSYQQALVAAQRAWIVFRDTNCRAFGYEHRGGSAERLSTGLCLVRMTKARTAELRLLASVLTPI
ncbi:MAG: DUF1311 domain-containing protein [Sphingomonas sp.]|nr:MAG: DUF1311 domain-containing protein [Sphingomonas sp.]